jgi:hypothetical protein
MKMLRTRHSAMRALALKFASTTLAVDERLPANPLNFLQAFQNGSVSPGHLQHLFSSTLAKDQHRALLAITTNPQQRARLLSLQLKNPLPNLDPSDPLCNLHNAAMVIESRLHLGLAASALLASDPGARSKFGFLLSDDIYHFGSCHLLKAQQIACHNNAYKVIAKELDNCGIAPSLEHQFHGTQQRVDVSWIDPLTGSKQHVDFTVCNPAARSVATAVKLDSMTAMRPLLAREKAKIKKHQVLSNAEGYSFYPWVVDPFGATTFTARKLVQKAVDSASAFGSTSAPTSKQFLDHITTAVYRGTAGIYSAGLGSADVRASRQQAL